MTAPEPVKVADREWIVTAFAPLGPPEKFQQGQPLPTTKAVTGNAGVELRDHLIWLKAVIGQGTSTSQGPRPAWFFLVPGGLGRSRGLDTKD